MNRKENILADIERRRISAIIRTDDAQLAADAMHAAVTGGFRMVEFTLTTPKALELVAQFSKEEGLLVGAGTVLSRQQARDAVAAGARFLVSPICDPEVIEQAGQLDVVSVPGTFTPTEMVAAVRMGADVVKLFPAPADVVGYVTALRGPLPRLRIFPTAGVDQDNFVDVLRAGAFGVGFVRSLFDSSDLAVGNMNAIERRARRITERFGAMKGSHD
ncbi:MAG: bifunctional 4-hydroxy-2-oxoglutarate aldolase/2-dehydro-3-deoxy-phosphogluconate aldolase [Phycisphaerae bacterium]